MRTKTVIIGIMPYDKFKRYTIAIACGKYKPKKKEPTVWFESIETMAQVLSTKNIELLKLIEKEKPQSTKELADASGRKVSNLSRTLKTFKNYGVVDIVENKKKKIPIAKATTFKLEIGKNFPFDTNPYQNPAIAVVGVG